MWTFKVEHKSNREFISGDRVMLREYPEIPMKVCYPFEGGVMCQIFGDGGKVGYRVFEVAELINFRVAAFKKHAGTGVEICLN